MTERKLMKDGLDKAAVSRLSSSLSPLFPDFENLTFQMEAFARLDSLELKERVTFLIELLGKHLPDDFEQTARTLWGLPNVWDKGHADDSLAAFAAWPIIDYIAEYGIDYPELSLETLRRLTPLFTAEFAIRPFLLEHEELTLTCLSGWLFDEDENVRRLVSEGTRPRLPWGKVLRPFIENPEEPLNLLDGLKDDPSEYVRRSVANHLNDISKDNPNIMLQWCEMWLQKPTPERQWIVRHATRTLIKDGHPRALALLGYAANPDVLVRNLVLDADQIMSGQLLSFTFDIESTASQSQKLVIDYAVHFVKASGKTQPKVFKLKSIDLAPGKHQRIAKSHSFQPITTRKYYEGEHHIELLINGISHGQQSFMLYP